MLTHLKLQNFKSWRNTGNICMAPLTGFFGTNSSGKTSILQFLLMLKQTAESNDRKRILHTGDDKTYVDLGTYFDIVHQHELPKAIDFELRWQLPKHLNILDPESNANHSLFKIKDITFKARIALKSDDILVDHFTYSFVSEGTPENNGYQFGMQLKDQSALNQEYQLIADGYKAKRIKGRDELLPRPIKTYGFPDQASGYYQNTGFLSDFVLEFEDLFQNLYYLGPLREYPNRSYAWAGERPQDVGRRGDLAVQALLGSRTASKLNQGKKQQEETVEKSVAKWLRDLGLIHDFRLKSIAKNRQDYEVRVRRTAQSSEVLITDVGFGVSQILPVLVLCYYAPKGSTIILEQPEIHLHPSIQAGLADVFIEVIKTRKIQIILESHSEHLLRRLQRRIAEAEHISSQDAALYFCSLNPSGQSILTNLEIDSFGNIANWPEQFFGDEMGDLVAMTEAAMKRQMAGETV